MTRQEDARPRIAFGNGHIRSLGSNTSFVIGVDSPYSEEASKYRSPNSWVGRSRERHSHYWVCAFDRNRCYWCGTEQ